MNNVRELSRREVSSQARGTTLPATMSPATPLGTLSIIPRELRNEIYQNLFPKKLVVYSRYKTKANSHVTHSLHLAIFRTSRLMGEEATRIFYAETIFLYRFDCPIWEHGVLPSPTLRRRMSNVEATIPCGYQHHLQYLGWFFCGLGSAGEESPLKNTLRIAFANAPRDMPRIGYSGLFEYLEYLRSFRNVLIEVTWMTYSTDESARIIHEISDADKERLSKFLGIVLEQIERKVAKVLKAGERSDMGPRTGLVYARRMTSHPR